MADLNELSQFERDLKNLIESRNTFQPNYSSSTSQRRDQVDVNETFMIVEEHGQPYRTPRSPNYVKKMTDWDQEQPYIVSTNMAIGEHGRPFRQNSKPITRMGIVEHGQPYNFFSSFFK